MSPTGHLLIRSAHRVRPPSARSGCRLWSAALAALCWSRSGSAGPDVLAPLPLTSGLLCGHGASSLPELELASSWVAGIGSPQGCRRERTGSNMADPKGVTERESYIIAQALYEFIRLEQSKPRDLRRWSDEQHAIAILHARFDNELATLVQSDVAAGCQPPDCGRKASIGG